MNSKNWIELSDLLSLLYLSERTFYKLKKANVFIAGEHFYRIGEGRQKGKCIYGLEQSGRVYLMLEPPNLPTLAEKIRANIQYRKNNIIKRFI